LGLVDGKATIIAMTRLAARSGVVRRFRWGDGLYGLQCDARILSVAPRVKLGIRRADNHAG